MFARWTQLDLTRIPRGRSVLASVAIDSVASGALLPFVPLYFVFRAGLSQSAVGVLMTLAAILALPAGTLTSRFVGRYGSARCLVVINCVRALAAVGALFATSRLLALVVLLLSTAGDNAFWAGNSTFVADITGDQRRRWYALEGSIRNAAMGLGALAGGVIVGFAGNGGLTVFMALNAVSFLVAAVLLRGVRTTPRVTGGDRPARALSVYTDVKFSVFLIASVLLVVPLLAMPSVLTLSLVQKGQWGAGLAGVLIALNVVILVLTLPVVSRRVERYRHRTVMIAAALSIAAGAAVLGVGFLLPTWGTAVCAVVGMVGLTAGELLSTSVMNDFVARIAPPARLAQYMAAYQLGWAAAGLLWPVVMLSLTARGGTVVWLVTAACGAVAAAACTLVRPAPVAVVR
ncbi:MFS transporter [Amycolatopsis nalaikhensis]|uniref:MFS transporter n=1 Tax=Amycolatopsis nalaikhensis TaxID=715472 RepID=A0ABY8XQX7_9PSEU|nr:MFS transporter [Amycolatopsis sp. 2-2]WIV58054.1 MFS transporter [Amycolatopsis sp. 2-2]